MTTYRTVIRHITTFASEMRMNQIKTNRILKQRKADFVYNTGTDRIHGEDVPIQRRRDWKLGYAK